MAIHSMTGFASVSGLIEGIDWAWELRTLNGRGLDIRLRVPSGFDDVETDARAQLSKALSRGSCQVSLQVKRTETAAEPQLNEALLEKVMEITRRLTADEEVGPVNANGLLAIKGMVEYVEPEPDDASQAQIVAAMKTGLAEAIELLLADRTREGADLFGFLSDQVETMARLRDGIASLPARDPGIHLSKLKTQIDQLLGNQSEFTPDRLHQEAAILATKADIREELDRLTSHIVSAKALLISDEPVGRKLDFLAQEFNREANTICSKSGDIDTTQLGLELKAVIDQFKEQVQNVE